MARSQGWFALILALAIAAVAACINFPLQLGLDLRGGTQLTLEVEPAGEIVRVTKEQLEAVKYVLDRRINGLGVAESTLQTIGDDQLLLQLPGEEDPSRAARVLGETALLEFRAQKIGTEEEVRNLQKIRSQLRDIIEFKSSQSQDENEPSAIELNKKELLAAQKAFGIEGVIGSEIEQLEKLNIRVNEEIVNRFEAATLTGKDLVTAGRQQQQNIAGWEVTLAFNKEGGEKFAELTKSIAGTGRLLGIVLDGRSISEASVGDQFKSAGITGGAATISGNFTAETARELEVQLRGGGFTFTGEDY